MALEIARIDVKPGEEAQFAAAYAKARHLIESAPGCHWMRMTRGVEFPSRFVLLVEWESVAAHEDFRASDSFPQWRAYVSPHFESRPNVEHFEDIDGA